MDNVIILNNKIVKYYYIIFSCFYNLIFKNNIRPQNDAVSKMHHGVIITVYHKTRVVEVDTKLP